MSNVFVSYSRANTRWRERVCVQLGEQAWTDTRIAPGEDWNTAIRAAIARADVAVLLVSADFLASEFIRDVEVPALLARKDLRVVPILVEAADTDAHPWLSRFQFEGGMTPLGTLSPSQAEVVIAGLAKTVRLYGRAKEAGPERLKLPPRIGAFHVPGLTNAFVGRDAELSLLDGAWNDDAIGVLALVAQGGAGKSAVVRRWVDRMKAAGWRGAHRVAAVSFGSQGVREQAGGSGEVEVDRLLRWLGVTEPPRDPWERGTLLADKLREVPTLLVLDGLEPLQHPPDDHGLGRVKDPAISALLEGLALYNNGLCVVTTRVAPGELDGAEGAVTRRLDALPLEAGVALLQRRGVKGTDEELEAAATWTKGHALALDLLGTWLATRSEGDARCYREVPLLEGADPVRRMLAAHDALLTPQARAAWRVLGLFDRAPGRELLRAVREPPIAGLTDLVQRDREWHRAVDRLRAIGLIEADGPIDVHPLARAYAAERLHAEAPAAWREAHGRVFDRLCNMAPDQPDTLKEMEPLLQAVGHGVKAGRAQEALDEVFYRRVEREDAFHASQKLGANAALLSALATFFDPPWEAVVEDILDSNRSWLLNEAGYTLRAVGRVADAVAPMRLSLEAAEVAQQWKSAASRSATLSQVELIAGNVSAAVAEARHSVQLADLSGDAFRRLSKRATLADALHQAGDLEGAAELFRDADAQQRSWQPTYQLLYSVQGYWYADLLLSRGEWLEARRRATQTLEWAGAHGLLLDVALDHLTIGRSFLIESVLTGAADLIASLRWLDEGVRRLRSAGELDELPRAHLARAELFRLLNDPVSAKADLDTSEQICTRCGLKLLLADTHLERARLLATTNQADARKYLEKGRDLVQACGYGRRYQEVADLERMLA